MLTGRIKLLIVIIILLKLKISLIIVYKTDILRPNDICAQFYKTISKLF